MNTFDLTVSTPDGNAFSGECYRIILRGAGGDLAVMANHTPFITSVKTGKVRITTADGDEKTLFTEGGLLTVAENRVTLLAGAVTVPEDYDEKN